jgi:prolyl 4-hydroxylase
MHEEERRWHRSIFWCASGFNLHQSVEAVMVHLLLTRGVESSLKVKCFLSLLCAVLCLEAESRSLAPLAFAGGFGGGNGGSKNKKVKRKQPKGGLSEISTSSLPTKSTEAKDSGPQLDKWGLPVATVDDLFPPMPPGTELIPIDTSKKYSLTDIQSRLKEYIDLGLDRYFDDGGTEKDSKGREPMQLRLLHQSPPVLAIDNFLTQEECANIKDTVDGAYQVNSATFPGALSTRTSTSWFCNYSEVPMLLAKANHLLNIPLQTMEEPQIVRYRKGQQFSWHYDEVPAPQLTNGGQRLATILVYLNDIHSGGGTVFRDLESQGSPLTVQPKRGSALLFFPAARDGRPDDRTLHKGEIMDGDDEKWIVQMWIHERAYHAVLPPGNSHEAARDIVEETSHNLRYTF